MYSKSLRGLRIFRVETKESVLFWVGVNFMTSSLVKEISSIVYQLWKKG